MALNETVTQASTLFDKYFTNLNENRKDNEGFRVRVKLGEVELEGEIKVPETRYRGGGGRRRAEPKAVTLKQLQDVLMGYDEEVELKEENGFFLVTTKRYLDNMWEPIQQAISGIAGGSTWVRKENSKTGKGHWRVKKVAS